MADSKKMNKERFVALGQAYAILCKIISTKENFGNFNLEDLLAPQTEPFILAKALTALKVLGKAEAAYKAAELLSHPNSRVRANAVELVALNPQLALEVLPSSLNDNNNRVFANAVLALSNAGKSFKTDRFQVQAKKSSAFCHSIFWLADKLDFEKFQFARDLLISPNPHLRDKAYKVIKELAFSGRAPSAAKTLNAVDEQIRLYKESADFFQNPLDKSVANILNLEKSADTIFNKSIGYKDKSWEVFQIEKIAKAAKGKNVFPAFVSMDMLHINKDMAQLKEYLGFDYANINPEFIEIITTSVQEELKVLNKRKKFVLECAVYDLLSIKNYKVRYPYLDRDLTMLQSKVWALVPAEKFSIIPNEEMGVLEIFFLALGIYQKHVWDFTKVTFGYILRALAILVIPAFPLLLDVTAGKLFATPFMLFYIPYCVRLFMRWQIMVILMTRHFTYGMPFDKTELSGMVTLRIGEVYWTVVRKYFIVGFIFGSLVVGAAIFLRATKALVPYSFLHSFSLWLNHSVITVFILFIFASLSMVEPLVVLSRTEHAIRRAFNMFKVQSMKITALFMVAQFLNSVITDYSMQLLKFVTFVSTDPSVNLIVLHSLRAFSQISLAPIFFISLTLYCLMRLKGNTDF